MTAAPRRSRAKGGPRQLALRILFSVIVLVPVAGLFTQVWQATGEKLSFGLSERSGIEYLTALGPLTTTLTQAQSAAVNGKAVDVAALGSAVEGVAAVDARLGEGLRVRERWAGIRVKVEALPGRSLEPEAALAGYTEVTDLLLALYGKVRENSQLVRDPGADAYYLQDGVAEQLPEAVVATGRFADLAVVTARRGQTGDPRAIAELIAARGASVGPARDLAEDVEAAAAGTQSGTLSDGLLGSLDRMRQTMDKVADFAALVDGQISAADLASVTALETEAIGAAAALSATMLTELDELIEIRVDGVRSQRALAVAAGSLAALLALAPTLMAVAMFLLSGRRKEPYGRHGQPVESGPANEEPQFPTWSANDQSAVTGQRVRERSGVPR